MIRPSNRGYVFFVLFFSLSWITCLCKPDRIKLKDIDVLTFRQDYLTTSRRTSPLPQLKCIGGSDKCAFRPDVVKCYNKGTGKDGNINWQCEAAINKYHNFGKININCEGYNHPKDEYIFADSCALEYTLESSGKRYNNDNDPKKSDSWLWTPTNLVWAWLWRILRTKSFQSFVRNIIIFFVITLVIYYVFFAVSNRLNYSRSRSSPSHREQESFTDTSNNQQSQQQSTNLLQEQQPDNTDALGGLWREFLTTETLKTFTRSDSSDDDDSDLTSPLINIGAKILTRQLSNRVRRR